MTDRHMLLDGIIHWLHLMAAVIWVGGMIFTSLILQPVLRSAFPPPQRMQLYREVGNRFRVVQWVCLGILFLTGFQKLWGLRESPNVFYSSFGWLLGLKLFGVVGAVFLSVLHSYVWGPRLAAMAPDPRNPEYALLMKKLVFWGKTNLLLNILIVFLAVLLRFDPF